MRFSPGVLKTPAIGPIVSSSPPPRRRDRSGWHTGMFTDSDWPGRHAWRRVHRGARTGNLGRDERGSSGRISDDGKGGTAEHGASYASAGVDIEAGDRAVELFKPLAKKATRPEVRGGLGGFAGLFALRGGLPRAPARVVDRRGRHQAGDRAGDGQARHRRAGPGRDGRRRPGGVRRRAAVPAGLHRRRPDRARARRRDRLRHRRTAACSPAARCWAARPPSTPG